MTSAVVDIFYLQRADNGKLDAGLDNNHRTTIRGQLDQYQTRRPQYHTFRLILSIFFHVLIGATVMTKPPRGGPS
jgi:hypothetical protein